MKKLILMGILVATLLAPASAEDMITLGAPGQDGELTSPRQIQEGPDGNIYVYDEVDAFIKVYSPQGKFLRKMGGEGQGPGEIQRRDGVSFGFTAAGKLFFTEFFRGHRWITLLELTGQLVGVIKLDISESFGVGTASALPDGSFLAEFHFSSEPEKQKDYYLYKSPVKLLRLDGQAKLVAEVRKAAYFTRISYRPDGADTELPFSPRFLWSLRRDQAVLFSDGLSPRIQVYDLSGRQVKEINLDLPEPDKVRDKDLDLWRRERKEMTMARNPGWWHEFGSVIEKYTKSIYKEKPTIDGITATPEGNILVSGFWDSETNTRNCWLLDENGKKIAPPTLVAGDFGFSRNFVFMVTTDEAMNMIVRVLKRSGKEREDFLKLQSVGSPGNRQE